MRADLTALNFMVKLMKFARRQAKFNPNQPRVPRGHENGGQWTDGGGYGAPTRENEWLGKPVSGGGDRGVGTGDSGWPTWGPRGDRPVPVTVSDRPGKRPTITIYPSAPPPGPGHNGGPPLDPPPEIPSVQPPGKGLPVRVAKNAARWIAAALATSKGRPTVLALYVVMEGTTWFAKNYLPYVTAYFQGPKNLQELQDAVDIPDIGTQVHHIVEQTPARNEGFPEERIQGRENFVRISTFKHEEITAWYNAVSRRKYFKGMSPRQLLEGKTWEERRSLGIRALKYFGVIVK